MSSKDSLLPKKDTNWRNHYVNGTPFTIAMATFALVVAGAIVSGAAMLVSGNENLRDLSFITSSIPIFLFACRLCPRSAGALTTSIKKLTQQGLRS